MSADSIQPPLRAPSANPPAPGRCPNCNGDRFSSVDNHRAAPSDQPSIGASVSMCDECGFVQTQIFHGRDMIPAAHRGLTGRRFLN